MEKPTLTLEALPETSQIREFERELSETKKKVKEVPKEVQDFKRRTRHRKPIEKELDVRITSLKYKYEEDDFRKLVKLASGYDAKIRALTEKIRKTKRDRDTRFLVLSVANDGFLVARGMIYKGERKGMDWGAKVAVNPKTLELEVHPFRDDYTKIIDGHEAIAHRVKILRKQRDEPSSLGSYRTNFMNPILGLEGHIQSDWKQPKKEEKTLFREIEQDYAKKAREFDMRLHFDQDLFWEFGDWLNRNVSPSGLMLPSFRRVRVEKGEAGEIGS